MEGSIHNLRRSINSNNELIRGKLPKIGSGEVAFWGVPAVFDRATVDTAGLQSVGWLSEPEDAWQDEPLLPGARQGNEPDAARCDARAVQRLPGAAFGPGAALQVVQLRD